MFCGCIAAAGLFTAGGVAHSQSVECAIFTPEKQRATAPDGAITKLMAGNERFVTGKTVNCDLMQQVKSTATGQSPFAAILSCIDSRVPPEFMFDQGIGDVFSARIAGNLVNTDIIGSLEFATKVSGARAIVVLGHTQCGAIKGAVDDVKLGNLTAMLENFKPAIATLTDADGTRESKNYKLVQKVADQNVLLGVASLTQRSTVLKELVDSGQLKIIGAMYDVATGKVAWM